MANIMAKMMKAAVVEKFGQPPGPGQALVKVVASGVCHTDLHAADGDWPIQPVLPFIPGHEGAGIVAALGPGATHVPPRRNIPTACFKAMVAFLQMR